MVWPGIHQHSMPPPIRPFAAALAGLLFSSAAWSATFTVNDAGDAGDVNPGDGICATAGSVCTLRAAIEEANATAGADIVEFAIGSGPATLTPASAYPEITGALSILGTTQPGSSANTLAVGNNAVVNVRIDGGGVAQGLWFSSGASNSLLRGVQLTRFANSGVIVGKFGGSAVSNVTIAGNFIGTDGSGSAADMNGSLAPQVAVYIGSGATDNLVGGGQPADRNLLAGNAGTSTAVLVADDTTANNTVRNNYIGVDRTGTQRRGRPYTGIRFDAAYGNSALRNVVGAQQFGIEIIRGAQSNVVQGNFIGVGADGVANVAGLPPGSSGVNGVLITDAGTTSAPQRNQIGGTSAGDGNTIANWGGDGVKVSRTAVTLLPLDYNAIQGNSIYANGGLGIELVDTQLGQGAGPSSPSPLTVNGAMRFPVVSSADNTVANGTSVGYLFTGAASTAYDMEFFANSACDASGYGEGQFFLGRQSIITNGGGTYSGTATGLAGVPAGRYITMTATSVVGLSRQTSEFSQCFQLTASSLAGTPPVLNPLPAIINVQAGQLMAFQLAPYVTPTDGDPVLGYVLTVNPTPGLSGMSFDSATGEVSGTPNSPVGISKTYTFTASDRDGVSNSRQVTFNVVAAGAASPPVMGDVPDAATPAGAPWSLALAGFVTLTDGDSILTYNLTGALPPGLGFDPVMGNFSGSPAVAGTYSFTVTATDKDGASNADTFTLTVSGGGGPVQPAAIPVLDGAGLALLSVLLAGLRQRRKA